jgi:hypothetical protein
MALIPELGRHTPYETTKDNAFERFPEIRGRYEHPEGVDILSVHEVKRWFNDATEVSLYGSRLIKYHVRRKSFGASISESAEKQLQVSIPSSWVSEPLLNVFRPSGSASANL